MVHPFSRTNNIGGLPAAVLNYIFSGVWVEQMLQSFQRPRLTHTDQSIYGGLLLIAPPPGYKPRTDGAYTGYFQNGAWVHHDRYYGGYLNTEENRLADSTRFLYEVVERASDRLNAVMRLGTARARGLDRVLVHVMERLNRRPISWNVF